MRIFLTAILLLCTQANAFVLVGDSIADHPTSWANLIRDDGTRIRFLTQPGRTIRDYDIPRDIRAMEGYQTHAVYALGTNDIFQRGNIPQVERQFLRHIRALKAAGFTVDVIAPPIYPDRVEWSRKMRAVIWRHKTAMGYTIVDIDRVWKNSNTLDGIHPTPEGHRVLADYIKPRVRK